MKLLLTLLLMFSLSLVYGQVELKANGPGDTYELITATFAPGYNPVEVPDCNHSGFGRHIDEVFDTALNTNVFRFFIHTTPDDDRCINFDRQRNEIKTYDKSPDNLLGIENEKVVYKWKFKLAAGFQSSPNFTHLHQLKSVGGALESMPMYTLTARKSTPDRLELRYAETNSQVTLTQTDLAPLIDTWLEVTETIRYGTSGTYEIEIKKVSDNSTLFSYSNPSIINWRPGATFVRPKWGIYRSLINDQDLRDETVLFADFSIEEISTTSSEPTPINKETPPIYSNPITDNLSIKNLSNNINLITIVSLEGRMVLEQTIGSETAINLDVSLLPKGMYLLNFIGQQSNQSELILIN